MFSVFFHFSRLRCHVYDSIISLSSFPLQCIKQRQQQQYGQFHSIKEEYVH